MIDKKKWIMIIIGFFMAIGLIVYPLIWFALSKILTPCGQSGGSAIGAYSSTCQCDGIKLPTPWIAKPIGAATHSYCLGKCTKKCIKSGIDYSAD